MMMDGGDDGDDDGDDAPIRRSYRCLLIFDVFWNFFVFQVFVKILISFFRAAAELKSLPLRPRFSLPPRRFHKLIRRGL